MEQARDDEPGYLNRNYVESFSAHGRAIYLPRAKGWLLRRAIPGEQSKYDAMGCYPLFCAKDWSLLGDDLEALGAGLVSLVLVSDPLAPVDETGE
jgi:hypothetical protein